MLTRCSRSSRYWDRSLTIERPKGLEFAVGGGLDGHRGGQSTRRRGCYPAGTVRLVEIRLLEGPNVYRLEPVVKVELAVGRRRTWYGQREPARYALVHLGAAVPARDWPDGIAAIVAWVRRLRVDHGEGRAGLAVHRSSDPGHWIVTFPWSGEERARTLAEAALGARGARRLPVADRPADRRAGAVGRALGGADRRGPDVAADLDPRRGPAHPDRVDLGHERQVAP